MYSVVQNVKTGEVRSDYIRRISDGAFIPTTDGNRDYEEYLLWATEESNVLIQIDPFYAPYVERTETLQDLQAQLVELNARISQAISEAVA